jgi:Amt family ammonium transporter
MGFNPGSFLGAVGYNFADVAINTNLAAAAGVIGATIGSLVMFKTLDVSQMGNGAIAGLVAITAPCAFVDPWAAVVIGFVVGILVPALVVLVDKLKIDDPIGCIPVHGVSGVLGTLAVGLFATRDRLDALNLSGSEAGIFYGGGGHQLWVQVYGVAATIAFTFTASFILFALIKYTVGLRVSEEDEMAGLDISEHGMYGYPEQFIEVPGAFPESARSDGSSLFAGSKTATSSQ